MKALILVSLVILSLSGYAKDLSAEINAQIVNTPPEKPSRTGTTAGAGTDTNPAIDNELNPDSHITTIPLGNNLQINKQHPAKSVGRNKQDDCLAPHSRCTGG